MLAETAAPAAPSPTPSTAARASCRPQTRVRAFRPRSVEYNYRSRRAARRRPSGKLASVRRLASDAGFYLFDGIDHPRRIRQGATTAYYELDLAFNVRRLRASGGVDLGGYRYSAFGQTKSETATVAQPLRWKGRWASPIAGGTYDVRARQWAPDAGVFLAVDEYRFHDARSTLWGWPRMNPVRWSDPSGHQGEGCMQCPPENPNCACPGPGCVFCEGGTKACEDRCFDFAESFLQFCLKSGTPPTLCALKREEGLRTCVADCRRICK